jgi:hypothetical protein
MLALFVLIFEQKVISNNETLFGLQHGFVQSMSLSR